MSTLIQINKIFRFLKFTIKKIQILMRFVNLDRVLEFLKFLIKSLDSFQLCKFGFIKYAAIFEKSKPIDLSSHHKKLGEPL